MEECYFLLALLKIALFHGVVQMIPNRATHDKVNKKKKEKSKNTFSKNICTRKVKSFGISIFKEGE